MNLRSASLTTSKRSSSGRARIAAGAAFALVAGTAAAFAVPGSALASCGTYGTGTTGILSTDGHLHVSTVWDKKPPGCYDFNVTYTDDTHMSYDYYTGWYKSGGDWYAGASGPHKLSNGSHGDFALVTNVTTGTPLMITSEYDVGDSVHVNY